MKLFSFSVWSISHHALFVFKVSVEKSALFWWVYLYTLFVFSFLQPLIFFLYFLCCFNDNMLWRGTTLVKSVSCPGGFLYLNGKTVLRFGKFSVIILLNVLCNPLACTSSPSQCPWFSGSVFWWNCWVLVHSLHSSWVAWLRNLLFFFFSFILELWDSVFYLF
jgi:hypothetical protein